MASSLVSNSDRTRESTNSIRKQKKKKNQVHNREHNQNQNQIKWKSQTQQEIYSSKLIRALNQVRLNETPRRGRAVRDAADRVLAVAAKGRTRWSRAILTNRLKLKFRKQKRQKPCASTGYSRPKKPRLSVLRLKGKSLPTVQRKVRVLGRLVPGCRKEALPVILEEATDYIAALEMQVRAMSALADLLSRSTSFAVAGTSSDSAPPS